MSETVKTDLTWDKLKVSDLIPERKVLTLPSTAKVEEVVEFLLRNRLQAAPVIDMEANRFRGFVDMIDIISFMLAQSPDQLEEVNTDFLTALEKTRNAFANLTVDDLIICTKKGSPPVVSAKAPAQKLVEAFDTLKVRRVAVEDDRFNVVNVISQTDVVQFLTTHSQILAGKDRQTLEQAKAVTSPVKTAPSSKSVLDVLRILHFNSVSAAAIVDDQGKIIANFSLSDLKGIARKDYGRMLDNVMVFLKHKLLVEKPFLDGNTELMDQSLFPVTCKPTDTVEYAMLKLLATKTHRLWVVSADGKPDGVVSLINIIKALLP